MSGRGSMAAVVSVSGIVVGYPTYSCRPLVTLRPLSASMSYGGSQLPAVWIVSS